MTLQDKFGILYAIGHCASRNCNNYMAKPYCDGRRNRNILYDEIYDAINNFVKQEDRLIKNLSKAEQCLIDNGIESDEAPVVL